MMPILNIGPLAIQLPGLLILLGLWLGLSLAERHAKSQDVHPNILYNLVFIGLIFGVISARLAYVARYPAIFSATPLSLISLNPGLLDAWGGVAGGMIVTLIYGQRKSLQFWPILDALTPLFLVLFIALGLSNLASGAGFGAPTQLPWGILLWGAIRHPTQIYESLAAILILVWLWPNKKWIKSLRPGVYFLVFLALSSAVRLFLEIFRGDSLTLPGGIRLTQIIAWFLLAVSLWGAQKLQHQKIAEESSIQQKK